MPLADTDRLAFYRELAGLAKRSGLAEISPVPTVQASSQGLDLFRSTIMRDPDHLRRKLLGTNALRLRKLSTWQRDALDVLGWSPDLLSPLGERRYEPSHTQALAYLMSPGRRFPLAENLLRSLLQLVLSPEDQAMISGLELMGATVIPEYHTASGRVDIVIEVPAATGTGLIVFIEVKVDAEEGEQQLKRYREEMQQMAGPPKRVLVYLTLEQQPDREGVVPLRFVDLLAKWLPVVAARRRDWTCAYAASYLKTLALLTKSAGEGAFDDWNFAQQRAALDLAELTREE